MWRYPDADVVVDAGEAMIALHGVPENVLPLGVDPDPEADNEPTPLRHSLFEVYRDLQLTATFDTQDSQAGEHLLTHVRRYGVPDLCQHGRPLWHSLRSSSRS